MKLMWFCIPAHGHTNPTIEVVRELVRRGHEVRYYSFEPFRRQIEDAGATYVPCDGCLAPIDAGAMRRLKRVSSTEMSVQAFRTTALMDGRIASDVSSFRPDLVVTDSVCFWGKLAAEKHGLPMVCSTTTFAFNRYAARYMKQSFSELADLVLGVPRLNRELAKLRPLGYRVKSALDLVQSKEDVDTIVFTSPRFQPCSETFDGGHYRFVGPSLREVPVREKDPARPLVYVSLGTVANERPDFYRRCAEALGGLEVEGLIACGTGIDPASLGPLPDNVRVQPYVDQLEVLSRASLFITHCGMNSASEGLYMGVPELLFPLTGEERAVARRVGEMGAGRLLSPAQAASAQALREAIRDALADDALRRAAAAMREDLRGCGGAVAAADFIESVGAARKQGA